MKKFALSLAFVAAAVVVRAEDVKPAASTAPAAAPKAAVAKPAPKPMAMAVVVVAVDPEGKTVTIKHKPADKTLNVAADARAAVMALKAGDKTTLWHDASGEVTGVKATKAVVKTSAVAKPATTPKASTTTTAQSAVKK
jgi:Cu/Ag efflux protein CusF